MGRKKDPTWAWTQAQLRGPGSGVGAEYDSDNASVRLGRRSSWILQCVACGARWLLCSSSLMLSRS